MTCSKQYHVGIRTKHGVDSPVLWTDNWDEARRWAEDKQPDEDRRTVYHHITAGKLVIE